MGIKRPTTNDVFAAFGIFRSPYPGMAAGCRRCSLAECSSAMTITITTTPAPRFDLGI
jgi:hypothetical protein